MPLISCEVSLKLKWNKQRVITSLEQRLVGANRDGAPTGASLAINDCKLYIPVVTLSQDDEIKLWTKYRSQMSTEAEQLITI